MWSNKLRLYKQKKGKRFSTGKQTIPPSFPVPSTHPPPSLQPRLYTEVLSDYRRTVPSAVGPKVCLESATQSTWGCHLLFISPHPHARCLRIHFTWSPPPSPPATPRGHPDRILESIKGSHFYATSLFSLTS